jgi:hypothetical protein
MTRISSKKVKPSSYRGIRLTRLRSPSVSSCLTWTAIHSSRLLVLRVRPVQQVLPVQPVLRAHRAQSDQEARVRSVQPVLRALPDQRVHRVQPVQQVLPVQPALLEPLALLEQPEQQAQQVQPVQREHLV